MKKYNNDKKLSSVKCILLCILILFFWQVNVYAKSEAIKKEIFLLAANPLPMKLQPPERVSPGSIRFPTMLYSIDAKKIKSIKVRDIIKKESGTEFVHYYYDEKLIIVAQPQEPQFGVLEMDAPCKETYFKISFCDLCQMHTAHLLSIPSRGLIQALNFFDAGKNKLHGMSLSTMKQEELPWEVYRYLLMSGIIGIGVNQIDWVYLNDLANGKFGIFWLAEKDIETDWTIPDSKLFSGGIKSASVNNNELLVVSSSKIEMKIQDGLLLYTYYIFNKRENKWQMMMVQGSCSGVRGFGPWLGGYVADKNKELESPGRAQRRQKRTETGNPVDWAFKEYKMYSPGILFLYNLYSQKIYYITTNQGDNEVLLVEDDTVYYRTNDEIYRAPIGDKEVGKPTLIAKDEVVPDIHWAFTTPYYPLEKGAFDNNDNGNVFYCMGRYFYKWSSYERKEFQDNLTNIYRYDFSKKETKKFFPTECYLQRLSVADKTHYVAGLCTDPGAKYNLLVLDKDGNKLQEVSDQIQEYVWHPDGDKILYMTGTVINYGDRKEITPTGIWLYDVTSGAKVKIAEKGSNLFRTGFDKHIYFSDGTKTLRYNTVKKIVETADTLNAVDYAADGKAYATGFDMLLNKMVAPLQIYDSTTNKSITPPHLSELHPANYEWGKDSGIIVFNGCKAKDCPDRQIYFYDLKKDKVMKQINGDLVGVTCDRTGFIVYRDGELILEKQ